MTSLSASAVSRTSVAPKLREDDGGVQVRILAREPGVVRPEDRQAQPARSGRCRRHGASTTATPAARAPPRAPSSYSGPRTASSGSSTVADAKSRITLAAPPMWSRCGCVRTIAVSDRSPSRRSWPATSASGGPSSTSTAAPGASTSTPSPCPTSRTVTAEAVRRRPVRGRSEGARRRTERQRHRHDADGRGAASVARQPSDHEPTVDDDAEPPPRRRRATGPGRSAIPTPRARRVRSMPRTSPRAMRAPLRAPGRTGSIAAAASESPISGGIAGSAATFAGTVQSATVPKCSQTIGAVTTPHATATATSVPEPAWHRIRVGHAADIRGSDDEDRGDGGERELEAGLERGGRQPAEEHERPERERVPAVARTRDDPGERGEDARDRGADDRRLPADGERVRQHDEDRHTPPRRAARRRRSARA